MRGEQGIARRAILYMVRSCLKCAFIMGEVCFVLLLPF